MDNQNKSNSIIVFYPDGTHYIPQQNIKHKDTSAHLTFSNKTEPVKKPVNKHPVIICNPDGTTEPMSNTKQEAIQNSNQILSGNINKEFNQIIDDSLPDSSLNQFFRNHYNDRYNFIFKGENGGIYRKLNLIYYLRHLVDQQQDKINNDQSHFWKYMLKPQIKSEQILIANLIKYNGDTMFILTQDLFGHVINCHAVSNKDIPKLKATLTDYIKCTVPSSKWKGLLGWN